MIKEAFPISTKEAAELFPSLSMDGEVARGGYKVVFRALSKEAGLVALKIICTDDDKVEKRVLREIEVSSKLAGPWFAKLHDFGGVRIKDHKAVFLVEEFLEGGSLRDRLQHEGNLPIDETKRIGENVLEALVRVEEAALVHRDIKPENIMFGQGERILLIDFGIARHLDLKSLTADYALYGPLTPGYSAPEQIRNEKRKISIRTDLFALGVVIYECLTGRNPFTENASATEAMRRCLSSEPVPLSRLGFSESVSDFVKSCLKKTVHRRLGNAAMALSQFRSLDWGDR